MFTQSQVKRVCNILFALLLLSLVVGIGPVPAQAAPAKSTTLGTAFTYQGQLKSGGSLVNGTCDLQFGLWDAWNVGNQIGSTQTLSPVTITNGLFTVTLDFGSNVFNGDARWLAIAVRCPAGGGTYTPLVSRQELTATPYALALPGLYTLPNATSPNLIGGYSGNGVTSGVVGATISGGGRSSYVNFVSDDYGTVGGGQSNIAGDYTGTTADQTFATVGGGYANNANSKYSTIGGGNGNIAYGGDSATVGGGYGNTAYGGSATVGGGSGNNSHGTSATVSGGLSNFANANYSTIGGGDLNNTSNNSATVGGGHSNTASGSNSTIGGGFTNTASGSYATIPGGYNNTAAGMNSFAAGRRAKANANGAFVWADSTDTDFTAGVVNSFIVRASGGIYFGSGTSSTPSTKFIDTWTGAYLSDSGVWTDVSDRNAKANFAAVNGRDVLTQLMAMPVSSWNYKVEATSIRHIGPTAQDFYSTFGVGSDDTHLAALDTNGVALAAIQGLYGIVQEKDTHITSLEARLSTLEQKNAGLEARLAALEQQVGSTRPPLRSSSAPWLALGGLFLLGVVIYRRHTNGGRQ